MAFLHPFTVNLTPHATCVAPEQTRPSQQVKSITARRMISGRVLKHLNGERFVIRRGYETARPVSSSFGLTVPFADTPADEPSAKRRGQRRLSETWQIVNDQIGDNKWILGEKFSAADIYLFMLTTWLDPSRGHPSISNFPNVQRIADAVMLRPSVQTVYGNVN